MFSTPLICSSIGAITVVATTSALAPGYWPLTLMIGGTISGYCAIGRRMNDTPPRMMNTIESTEAKIGRSMKKWEIFIVRSPGTPIRKSEPWQPCHDRPRLIALLSLFEDDMGQNAGVGPHSSSREGCLTMRSSGPRGELRKGAEFMTMRDVCRPAAAFKSA